jgi:hypothetical protein
VGEYVKRVLVDRGTWTVDVVPSTEYRVGNLQIENLTEYFDPTKNHQNDYFRAV